MMKKEQNMNHITRLSNGKAVFHGFVYRSVVAAMTESKRWFAERDITFHIADDHTNAYWLNREAY